MKLKQYLRFEVNFKSRWIETSAALMGISIFLRILFYFAVTNLRDIGGLELFFSMLLGLALSSVFIICLTCLRLNAPGLYGIIGTAICLTYIVLSFMSGDPVRIVLSFFWYLLSAIVLLATTGGYLPGRLFSALLFATAVTVRFFFYDLGKLNFVEWVRELPALCIIASLGCLVMGFRPRTK